MIFEGEHLFAGQLGHFFVILSFVASIVAAVSFFKASNPGNIHWLKAGRIAFGVQVLSVIIIFSVVFYICSNHYYEYMYAYKHASKELEYKYLLACIWEGQEGSFLLWSIWHSILGAIFIIYHRKKQSIWEAPVMTVVALAQFFLFTMILGIYFFDIRIGNSLFTLTRNEINGPIFSEPNYLNFIRDGLGLNVLLRNYWMVIHPPVLFLGLASTIIPFAFAYAGIRTKQFGDWVKPALPWALFSACVLGVGIMMGGKWAYESLSFGGYWAWDPVENASLVPWLILIAGLHTMVIYKATGHSLRASYLFMILSFVFVLYSTFLTRTGILGDTSVHAFTEAGNAMNFLIGLFVAAFTLPSLFLLFRNFKKIPAFHTEETTSSREFWMFIGSIVFFLTAIFIIAKTSVPVYNKITGSKIAPPEDVEFSYNKVVIMVAIIVGLLTAVSQYFKYKSTTGKYFFKKIAFPTILAALLIAILSVFYPMEYYKHGIGFLGAIYVALFAALYAAIANSWYIISILKGKMKHAGASVAHAGFALMLAGMLISSSNKNVISSSRVNGITLPASKDPMTKQTDDPQENLTLIRDVPAGMAKYDVTYLKDSSGHEKGRKFYKLLFREKDKTSKGKNDFVLEPDVYLMKDNNMSSNPDTKSYLSKDIFTYISFALNDKTEDTSSFREVILKNEKDTAFYKNGYFILKNVVKNPSNGKYNFTASDAVLAADILLVSKDSMRYKAMPAIQVVGDDVAQLDDTLYAQNMYFRFIGITEDQKIRIGVKESDRLIDFVTVKAYIFPYINMVWLGLVIMAIGLLMSMIKRAGLSIGLSATLLLLLSSGIFYMFLLAN